MASFDGLSRMEALLAELGNPERDFKVIHIAGTNGKGSTAVMIASILEEAGYSVGLFMSPHLEDECERVQIWDGTHRLIEEEDLNALKEKVKEAGKSVRRALSNGNADVKNTLHSAEELYGKLTLFEIYTAAAYLYFKEQSPDYVVLETGLGGRLDSTNTIEKPLACVITQLGLDHTKELGCTIGQIATEKAGIIKSGVPIISQSGDPIAKEVIEKTAKERFAVFIDADEFMSSELLLYAQEHMKLGMRGEHQIRNAITALLTIKAAGIEVSDEAVENGLASVSLPGRIEIIGEHPYWIIDGAHNPDAIEVLIKTYKEFADNHLPKRADGEISLSGAAVNNSLKRTLVIFGCMQDKDLSRMIQLLAEGLGGCEYASCAVDYSRAEDPTLIADKLKAAGARCTAFDNVRAAYEHAKGRDYECILVTGSIYLAGEIRSLYMRDKIKTEYEQN